MRAHCSRIGSHRRVEQSREEQRRAEKSREEQRRAEQRRAKQSREEKSSRIEYIQARGKHNSRHAKKAIRNARDNLGVPCFIQPADICKPNKNLNLAFCAQIFNTNPGLTVSKDELEEVAAAGIMDDDVGDTREEVGF